MRFERRDFIRLGAAGVAGVFARISRGFAQVSNPPPTGAQLSIEFSGLCAFATVKTAQRMDVILVEAKSAGLSQKHEPVLIAKLSNVREGSWLPAYVLPGLDGEQIGVWDLTNYDLTIPSSRTGNHLRMVRGSRMNAYSKCPLSREDWKDISWVADLEKACGDGLIKPACLQDNPAGAPVAARFRLTEGTVESVMPTNVDFRDIIWKFQPQLTPTLYEQPLADLVRYTFDSRERLINLELRPFAGGESKRLKLETSPLDDGLIPVSVSNLPPVQRHGGELTHHFSAFYSLLASPPAARPVPQIARRCEAPRTTKRGIFPVDCPPAMLYQQG